MCSKNNNNFSCKAPKMLACQIIAYLESFKLYFSKNWCSLKGHVLIINCCTAETDGKKRFHSFL